MIESSPRPIPTLPAELVIYHVSELRQQWLAALEDEGEQVGPWAMGAHAVDEVDAAGLQLLLALASSLHLRGRTLQLVNASKPLRAACKRLNILHLIAADISAEDTP